MAIQTFMNGVEMKEIYHNGSRLDEMYMNGIIVYKRMLELTLPQAITTINIRSFIDANNSLGADVIIITNNLIQPSMITGNLSGLTVTLINNGEFRGTNNGDTAVTLTTPMKLDNRNGWIRGAGGKGGDGGKGGTGTTRTGSSGSAKFTSSTTWTAPARVSSVNLCMIGGGGGGANNPLNKSDSEMASGGRAGDIYHDTSFGVSSGGSHSVVIGAGGGGHGPGVPSGNGSIGGASRFHTKVVNGGAGGTKLTFNYLCCTGINPTGGNYRGNGGTRTTCFGTARDGAGVHLRGGNCGDHAWGGQSSGISNGGAGGINEYDYLAPEEIFYTYQTATSIGGNGGAGSGGGGGFTKGGNGGRGEVRISWKSSSIAGGLGGNGGAGGRGQSFNYNLLGGSTGDIGSINSGGYRGGTGGTGGTGGNWGINGNTGARGARGEGGGSYGAYGSVGLSAGKSIAGTLNLSFDSSVGNINGALLA